jgi:excisionase family DNA binding protein
MDATTAPKPLTLTVDETAALLGISRGLAYEGVRRGEIPSVKVGKRIVVPRTRLEAWLAGERREELGETP